MQGGDWKNLFRTRLFVPNLLNTSQNNTSFWVWYVFTCSCLDRNVVSSNPNYMCTLASLLSKLTKADFATIVQCGKTSPKSQLITMTNAFSHSSVSWLWCLCWYMPSHPSTEAEEIVPSSQGVVLLCRWLERKKPGRNFQ